MSRTRHLAGQDLHRIWPETAFDDVFNVFFSDDVPLLQAVEWLKKVRAFRLQVTWPVDPSVHRTSGTSFVSTIDLFRASGANENHLIFGRDLGTGAIVIPAGMLRWQQVTPVAGLTPIADLSTLTAQIEIFQYGTQTPASNPAIAAGFVRPSIRTSLSLINVGLFAGGGDNQHVLLSTSGLVDLVLGTGATRFATGSDLQGAPFGFFAATDAGAPAPADPNPFLTGAPTVTLSVLEYFAYAGLLFLTGGSEPLYDTGTGAVLPGQDRLSIFGQPPP